jgi:hypothetical protein
LLPLLGRRKTGEPLSPPPTAAVTIDWQSWVMLVPDTLTLTQVLVIRPRLQPVVRPTLFAVWPTTGLPSEVILNRPEIVSDPLLGPVVFAISPSVEVVPLA